MMDRGRNEKARSGDPGGPESRLNTRQISDSTQVSIPDNPATGPTIAEKLAALSPTAYNSLLESQAAKKFFHKRTLASPLIVPFVRGGSIYSRTQGSAGIPESGKSPDVSRRHDDFPGGDAA